jgi:hypothetical protein
MPIEMKVQITAMPLKVHQGLKTQLDSWKSKLAGGITAQFVPSFHPKFPLVDESLINRIEANIQDGFVHILVVNDRAWNDLRKRFGLDCRVIALSAYPPHISWEDFQAELDEKIGFEYQWCEAIRPVNPKGPLFLPVGGFQPESKYKDFWRACDCYKKSSELSHARDLLTGVYAKHNRRSAGTPRYWVDSGEKMFKIDPNKHALYPEQRSGGKRFRFCALVPPGFHYDVVHERGNEFNLIGRQQTYKNIRRANIDPWGSVRLP